MPIAIPIAIIMVQCVDTMQSLDRRVAIRSQIALRDSFRNDWCGNRRSLQVTACEWKMLSGLRRYILRRRTWSHAGQKDGTQSLAWWILDMWPVGWMLPFSCYGILLSCPSGWTTLRLGEEKRETMLEQFNVELLIKQVAVDWESSIFRHIKCKSKLLFPNVILGIIYHNTW